MINTGWTGGPYGTGNRISIANTRAMISAALSGKLALDKVDYLPHPVFGILVPQSCPGVPSEILDPSETWADRDAYDHTAAVLAQKFRENFSLYENALVEYAI
jgi:phosphoenolpyruvate carboxykinase (ATP)